MRYFLRALSPRAETQDPQIYLSEPRSFMLRLVRCLSSAGLGPCS
jgi:hypothetical protein